MDPVRSGGKGPFPRHVGDLGSWKVKRRGSVTRILVTSGCHSQIPDWGLQQRAVTSSQCWRLEVDDCRGLDFFGGLSLAGWQMDAFSPHAVILGSPRGALWVCCSDWIGVHSNDLIGLYHLSNGLISKHSHIRRCREFRLRHMDFWRDIIQPQTA